MIEIEKKFILREGDRERLLKDAEFVKKQTIHDTYYDTKDYSLAKKDWWLRFRNGNFELKVSFRIPSEKEKYAPTQYRELETEEEIRKALDIPASSAGRPKPFVPPIPSKPIITLPPTPKPVTPPPVPKPLLPPTNNQQTPKTL